MAPLAFTDPMAYIATQLAAYARGETYDQGGMEEAATLVCAAQLVKAGLSMNTVETLFRDRDYSFKFGYERATDELTVDVIWDDAEAQP